MLKEGSLKVAGSKKYQNAVRRDLYKIANTVTGRDTLNTIRRSGQSTTIQDWLSYDQGNGCSPHNSSAYLPPHGDGEGAPSTVWYNPREQGRPPGSPPDTGLNHEMGHAANNAVGTNQRHIDSPVEGYPNMEEYRNVTTVDNAYRDERGLPRRRNYKHHP